MPFQNMMSGDWINHWQTTNGDYVFMIGDVVGKGPQAGLAVAVIAATIDRFKHADGSSIESVLQEINSALYRLFSGMTNTTITAIKIDSDNKATLYNAGGLGWFHYSEQGGKIHHHLTPGILLGQEPRSRVGAKCIDIHSGDFLYTFTDGVCSKSQGYRRVARDVENLGLMHESQESHLVRYFNLTSADEIQDDKTMLMIQLKRPSSLANLLPFQGSGHGSSD